MVILQIKRSFQFLKRRFYLVLWISLVSYLFYNTFIFYKEERKFYRLRRMLGLCFCIARGTATVINLSGALVLLPLCKMLNRLTYRLLSRVWPGLFFFWLESAKSFHMTVGITLFVAGVVHSVSHFVNLWHFSRNYDDKVPDVNLAAHKDENPLLLLLKQPGLTGTAMLVITTTIFVTSLRIVRRRIYNAFWYTHQMYLPFIVLLIVHPLSGALKQEVLDENEPKMYSSQANNSDIYESKTPKFESIKSKTWLWLAFPLTCFFIDLMWRIVVRNNSNVQILKINLMAGRILGLTLSCPDSEFKCRAGQYVLLQCPDISLLEWHPFTVVKVPTTHERDFVIWIKVAGDWTECLEKILFQKCEKVRMLVDGPMLSPMERLNRSRVTICVAAGVGVTPFMPVMYEMLSEPRKEFPERMHLIWIVRTEEEASVLARLATRCMRTLRDHNRPDRLHIVIHITGSAQNNYIRPSTMVNEQGITCVVKNENNATAKLLPSAPNARKENAKGPYSLAREYPVLACRLRRGRPHWDKAFGNWISLYPRKHLTLFCCGPKKLVQTLKTKCKEFSLISETKFTFVHERFS